MKVTSTFSHSRIAFDKSTTVFLKLTTTAPKLTAVKRIPLNLIVALDVSPSMNMPSAKLDFAKKSAKKLVEHLSADDRLGILLFDHHVRTLSEPINMTPENKAALIAKIDGVRAQGGGTNIWAALNEGFKMAARIDAENVKYIFLTDGCPTTGETNPQILLKFAKAQCPKNVAITSFGYGSDHDSTFLTTMAGDNKGNYSFIQNPDDALTAFGRELGGLLSCYGQDLKWSVTPKDGVKIVKVLSDIDVEQVGEGIEMTSPDIYSEAVRNLILKVEVPKQKVTMPRPVTLIDVNLSYTDVQSGEAKTLSAKAKLSFVKAGDAQKDPDVEVMEQVALADLFEAQKEAMNKARGGDFAGAQSVLRGVNTVYMADATMDYMTTAVNAVSNASDFNNHSYLLNATLSSNRSGRYSAGGASVGSASLSNSVQDSMAASFSAPDLTAAGNVNLSGGNTGILTVSPGALSGITVTTAVVPDESLSKKKSGDW